MKRKLADGEAIRTRVSVHGWLGEPAAGPSLGFSSVHSAHEPRIQLQRLSQQCEEMRPI